MLRWRETTDKMIVLLFALVKAILSDQKCSWENTNCPNIDARGNIWIWETPSPYSHLSCCKGRFSNIKADNSKALIDVLYI